MTEIEQKILGQLNEAARAFGQPIADMSLELREAVRVQMHPDDIMRLRLVKGITNFEYHPERGPLVFGFKIERVNCLAPGQARVAFCFTSE